MFPATKKIGGDASESEHYAAVESVMRQFDYQEHGLVEVLISAQESFGCLTKELMEYVSKKLHVPIIRIYSNCGFC